MNEQILHLAAMDFPWQTIDPFLFCVHHADAYPRGNEEMGPAASLEGRLLGQDFTLRDGWRMYHGERIPGFPAHPHRGFETVTAVVRGYVDHSDSHGAAGRYGQGDVQWMTAGRGLQHAEMFPLLNRDEENPLELFQIWLNLPASKKFVEPHFRMLWSETIPVAAVRDSAGHITSLRVIAGRLSGVIAPAPAPDSWAADESNDVVIAIMDMDEAARYTLPPAPAAVRRTMYAFEGKGVSIADTELPHYHYAELRPDAEVSIESPAGASRLLLLQGKPINETVMQYGPFVMNTREEIQQAFDDYRRTQFGGWPWSRHDNVHPRERGRFAHHADRREETPPGS
jgi:quercetin 2,3-dioxygenase